jgi:uncharacterized membrane protein
MKKYLSTILTTVFLLFSVINIVYAQNNMVRAVLFYSPTCPHCHEVMENDLPPLIDQYGEQLQILQVNVSDFSGQILYQAALEAFAVPDNRLGVPALVAGGSYLVGSQEIPDLFPNIISQALASTGLEWPAIPGLDEFLTSNSAEFFGVNAAASMSVGERFAQDPFANSIAVIVLVGMVASVYLMGKAYSDKKVALKPFPDWAIPALLVIGLAAAIYLSYVEITQVEAVCGPVGECNLVQQSPYAKLFGVLPVGVLGVLGYLSIALMWAFSRFGKDEAMKKQAIQTMWWLVLGGVLFSIYLTFLEPFVIGATCVWCITSAVVMTLLLWGVTPMWKAVAHKRRRKARRPR